MNSTIQKRFYVCTLQSAMDRTDTIHNMGRICSSSKVKSKKKKKGEVDDVKRRRSTTGVIAHLTHQGMSKKKKAHPTPTLPPPLSAVLWFSRKKIVGHQHFFLGEKGRKKR